MSVWRELVRQWKTTRPVGFPGVGCRCCRAEPLHVRSDAGTSRNKEFLPFCPGCVIILQLEQIFLYPLKEHKLCRNQIEW